MSSAASAALFLAWAYQWVGIIGSGLLPVFLQPSLGRYPWFWRIKSLCSLVGLVLCILSGPLVLDTYAVESGRAGAVEKALCRITEMPANRWAGLHCEGGTTYRVEGDFKANEGQNYTLYYLANSRIVVEAVMVK